MNLVWQDGRVEVALSCNTAAWLCALDVWFSSFCCEATCLGLGLGSGSGSGSGQG